MSLYVWGGLHLIYQNVTDSILACTIATLIFCLLSVLSKLVTACPPTRQVGEQLQDRILKARANWERHPVRSATEICVLMGVALKQVLVGDSLHSALQLGTLAGMLCCLAWEAMTSPDCRTCLRNLGLRLLTKIPLCAFGIALAFAPLLSDHVHPQQRVQPQPA